MAGNKLNETCDIIVDFIKLQERNLRNGFSTFVFISFSLFLQQKTCVNFIISNIHDRRNFDFIFFLVSKGIEG